MKKYSVYNKLIIILLILAFAESGLQAQIRVSKIDPSAAAGSVNGFVYSLPQTVLKVDIVYQKTEKIVGPLAEYAQEYLGVDNYIRSNITEYNIVNAEIERITEPDPSQLFYVQYPVDRAKDETSTSFALSKDGCLVAYNIDAPDVVVPVAFNTDQTFIFEKGKSDFPFFAQYNKQKRTDTIVRKISIDTLTINRFIFNTSWVDKNDNDKAKDAAQQIEKLREARFNLMSGYQEVNYGSSIMYMDHQIQKMEEQYSELFIGKELTTVDRVTLYFIPEKTVKSSTILKMGHSNITMDVEPESEFKQVNSEPQSAGVNVLYYRVPASSKVIVKFDGDVICSERMPINQLGIVSTIPMGNNKIQFDPITGNVISIQRP